jgi:hypothetical protein
MRSGGFEFSKADVTASDAVVRWVFAMAAGEAMCKWAEPARQSEQFRDG